MIKKLYNPITNTYYKVKIIIKNGKKFGTIIGKYYGS